MQNDLNKFKSKLSLIRKVSIRSAFLGLLIFFGVKLIPKDGKLLEDISTAGFLLFISMVFLGILMITLEDEFKKSTSNPPFGLGKGHFYNPEDAMKAFTESSFNKDDLFAPFDEGSKLTSVDEDDSKGVFATFDEGIESKAEESEKENEDYWKEKLESIPERTRGDFKERATALRELKEKTFDLLRNEFLAHVFGTPNGDELPEGQDPLTFNPKAYYCDVYISNVLLDMDSGQWLHYQNRLKTLFKDEYQIDFDEEGNVAYQLK